MSSNPVLEAIRTRRVVRALTDEPVGRAQLEDILKAGRWAPSGGNRRLHRYVAVHDPLTLRLLRMVSPGMLQKPQAIVLICIDWQRVGAYGLSSTSTGLYVDVGTAAQTMLLAAHSLGLASGIVTSFPKAGVRAVLNLPAQLSPELFVCLGHAAPGGPAPMRTWGKITWQSLVDWERFPGTPSAAPEPAQAESERL
ncbi:MAG: nitroreductase family protein [Chloroflexi bacterium]|nr:nitroreductase family protein [Chloroflexota bacterium]